MGTVFTNIAIAVTPLIAAAEQQSPGGTGQWDKLEEKLQTAGSGANEFIHLCQDYWYIPMFFALVVYAALILAGGKQGRIQAKSGIWWTFVSIAIVFCIPTIVSLFASLAGKETTDISTLT